MCRDEWTGSATLIDSSQGRRDTYKLLNHKKSAHYTKNSGLDLDRMYKLILTVNTLNQTHGHLMSDQVLYRLPAE